jgi:hypothetical protein
MGLDTSHDCWHGAYSAFMRWREKIADAAGLPPLQLMEGFYEPLFHSNIKNTEFPTLFHGIHDGKDEYLKKIDSQLPIKWECLKPSPLFFLLHHSDCDGNIPWSKCRKIANELEKLISKLPDEDDGGHIGNWREKTQKFVNGLRLAYSKKENVRFF